MRSRIVSIARTIPFAGNQLALTIPVDINPVHGVVLCIERINGMLDPRAFPILSLTLFVPVKAVSVTLHDNNVILAILIHVHDQNRDAGSATLKFEVDRKSTRLNSSHSCAHRMPATACKKKT